MGNQKPSCCVPFLSLLTTGASASPTRGIMLKFSSVSFGQQVFVFYLPIIIHICPHLIHLYEVQLQQCIAGEGSGEKTTTGKSIFLPNRVSGGIRFRIERGFSRDMKWGKIQAGQALIVLKHLPDCKNQDFFFLDYIFSFVYFETRCFTCPPPPLSLSVAQW